MSEKPVSVAPALSGRALARAIFDCDIPEEMVKNLPAQAVYYAVLENGLDSSTELLHMLTVEQQKLLLDFDCWERDDFREDRFWIWLDIACSEDNFSLLRKIIQAVDLKLIALMIARYTDIVTHEEPTDAPPGPNFYTPDRGYTWIGFKVEDTEKERLMGRLLAYLFESNKDLFHQIIQIPTVETVSVLEEESFQDKERRIQAEGIPSREGAHETLAPLKTEVALAQLREPNIAATIPEITPIEPIIAGRFRLDPLQTILQTTSGLDDVKAELTFLMNSLIVKYNIPFNEDDALRVLRDKMLGSINIGLQQLCLVGKISPQDIVKKGGFRLAFQVGFGLLQQLKNKLTKPTSSVIDILPKDGHLFLAIAGIKDQIPSLPEFFDKDLDFKNATGLIEPGWRAFEHIDELAAMERYIESELQKLEH